MSNAQWMFILKWGDIFVHDEKIQKPPVRKWGDIFAHDGKTQTPPVRKCGHAVLR